MPEFEYMMESYGVGYCCDNCGKGDMTYDRSGPFDDRATNKLLWPHSCKLCGHAVSLSEIYPTIRYRRVLPEWNGK